MDRYRSAHFIVVPAICFALSTVFITQALSQTTITTSFEIGEDEGGFGGDVEGAAFGSAVTALGDVNDDGVIDLAVGAPTQVTKVGASGAVWILFMNPDGSVDSEQELSATDGDADGAFDGFMQFGRACAGIGDINDDGVPDLMVGSNDDTVLINLKSDGTVSKVTELGLIGWTCASLGDLDGNGVTDVAVGGEEEFEIFFLDDLGTVDSSVQIADSVGGFDGDVASHDAFGFGIAAIGDVDGDGVTDLAVGANRDDDGGHDRGAVWILFMEDGGEVADQTKISSSEGGFGGTLLNGDYFGYSLTGPGDLNADGVPDLIVGAPGALGAAWILHLKEDGTVKDEFEIPYINSIAAGFGVSIAALGDVDGDGAQDLAIGSLYEHGNGTHVVWLCSLGYPFKRGDANGDSIFSEFTDLIFLMKYKFSKGPKPPCMDAADVTDNGEVHGITDALLLLQYSFEPGIDIPGPEDCGKDPTQDRLTCAEDTCD